MKVIMKTVVVLKNAIINSGKPLENKKVEDTQLDSSFNNPLKIVIKTLLESNY